MELAVEVVVEVLKQEETPRVELGEGEGVGEQMADLFGFLQKT